MTFERVFLRCGNQAFFALCCIAFPLVAVAQATCDTAQVIANSKPLGFSISGDTTTAGNPIGALGPLPSPHNDLIYTFVVGAGGASGNFVVVAADYNYGIFLTTDCNGSTSAPIQAATGPAVGNGFPVGDLTPGNTYYLIVSGNPSVNAPQNGTFTVSVPMTPVSLQSFSID